MYLCLFLSSVSSDTCQSSVLVWSRQEYTPSSTVCGRVERGMNEWTGKGQAQLRAAKALHTEAITAFHRKEFGRSMLFLYDALKLRKGCLPESHPVIIATLEFMAHVCNVSGDKERCRAFLEEEYKLMRERLGPCSIECEDVLERLWQVCSDLGEKQTAEEYAAEVWRIRGMSQASRNEWMFDNTLKSLSSDKMRRRLQSASFVAPSTETDVQSSSKVSDAKGDGSTPEPATVSSPPPTALDSADGVSGGVAGIPGLGNIADSSSLTVQAWQRVRPVTERRSKLLDDDEWFQDLRRKMMPKKYGSSGSPAGTARSGPAGVE